MWTQNEFIRAFWRRIEPQKQAFEKEFPGDVPVQFRAATQTALMMFPECIVVDNNRPDSQHIIELPPNTTLDVGTRYKLVPVE
jgi:hypothetical protein